MAIITPETIGLAHSFMNGTWLLDIDPELSHQVAMILAWKCEKKWNRIKELVAETFYLEDKSLETQIWNMIFRNPVWLAAWFAKKSDALLILETFWFWYLTIWWITHDAQPGNLKPRVIKFRNLLSIVNGMWLPGDWVDMEVKRLEMRKQLWLMPSVPLIANLCNSANTKEEDKVDEFRLLMEKLYLYVDWFEINISCPNQKWVCGMQKWEKLKNLLKQLQEHNKLLATRLWMERKTLLVKLAPLTQYEDEPKSLKIKDLTMEDLEIMINVLNDTKNGERIDWVTATNTTQEHGCDVKIIRPDWVVIWWWGSGKLLTNRSIYTVQKVREILDKDIPIIWVGWLWFGDGTSCVDMQNAWAKSIQMLTSFIYWVDAVYNSKKAILESKGK